MNVLHHPPGYFAVVQVSYQLKRANLRLKDQTVIRQALVVLLEWSLVLKSVLRQLVVNLHLQIVRRVDELQPEKTLQVVGFHLFILTLTDQVEYKLKRTVLRAFVEIALGFVIISRNRHL